MSGFFTEKAIQEQEFLRKNYPRLFDRYNPYTGYITILDEDFKSSVTKEAWCIIAETFGDSRYVMFRSELPDENGEMTKKGFVICQANIVE